MSATMKMRIRGDSLRLRLTRSEVERLVEQSEVRETVHFGGDAKLVYVLVVDSQIDRVEAALRDGEVTVRLPAETAEAWATSAEVTIKHEQPIGGDRVLALLIEKDFQCLVPHSDEDQSDAFPNPNAGTGETC